MSQQYTQPPLVAHIIYRLDFGGLENGLVNLINRMPAEHYRHAVICLKDATDFRQRITRDGVSIYEMHRREGQDLALLPRLWKLLKTIQPTIVHTRNLAAIECQLSSWLAGVPCRVHGEHGWDVFDPQGENRKYQLLRRVFGVLIQRFVPLSKHLETYLVDRIGIPSHKIARICNGVDADKFRPRAAGERRLPPDCPFLDAKYTLIGTIGRMHSVKDQTTLAHAFIRLVSDHPEWRDRARLIMVGDGPLRASAEQLLSDAGCRQFAWLPGTRSDTADVLRSLDIFALPSEAEGISNTILEAMASGLPVVATAVGGNPELVVDGETGFCVRAKSPEAMAEALAAYLQQPELRVAHGAAARARVLAEFDLTVMVERYQALYDAVMRQKGIALCAG